MRSKLMMGLACAGLAMMIGAAWAATIAAPVGNPEVAALPEVASPAPSCCCAAPAQDGIGLLYCPLTDTINVECCCKVIDGKWVCQVTGIVSDECCCIPVTIDK